VETVKGYAKEETAVFENLGAARARMAGARNPQEKIEANSQISSALGRLIVVAEAILTQGEAKTFAISSGRSKARKPHRAGPQAL